MLPFNSKLESTVPYIGLFPISVNKGREGRKREKREREREKKGTKSASCRNGGDAQRGRNGIWMY